MFYLTKQLISPYILPLWFIISLSICAPCLYVLRHYGVYKWSSDVITAIHFVRVLLFLTPDIIQTLFLLMASSSYWTVRWKNQWSCSHNEKGFFFYCFNFNLCTLLSSMLHINIVFLKKIWKFSKRWKSYPYITRWTFVC